MPTLPLLNIGAGFDGWRQVRAPGGYECWRVFAHDEEQDCQVIAEMWRGDAFDPRYAARFAEFMRRPTRNLPPVPHEFIATRMIIVRAGQMEFSAHERVPADQFAAQTNRVDVRLGAARLTIDEAGVELKSPTVQLRCKADVAAPHEAQKVNGVTGTHMRCVTHALHEINAQIALNDVQTLLHGRGCVEHVYGDRPTFVSASRWLRGRAISDDSLIAFDFVTPTSRTQTLGSFMHFGPAGLKSLEVASYDFDWKGLAVNLPGILKLNSPRAIESTGAVGRFAQTAELYGKPARAWSEFGGTEVAKRNNRRRPIVTGVVA